MQRILLFTIAAAVALVPARRANANIFSMPAAACVPDNLTAQGHQYLISGGTIRFQPTAVGDLQFWCAIPGSLPISPWHLFIAYSTTGSSSVGATYSGAAKSTGLLFGPLATVNPPGTNGAFAVANSDAIDPATYGNYYVYFVSFTLSRSSTADNPVVYALGLN